MRTQTRHVEGARAALSGPGDEVLRDALGWDVGTWARAWHACCRHSRLSPPGRALEVGADAENGGLSLLLAVAGWDVTCSGLGPPTDRMRALHSAHGVAGKMRYAVHDALDPVPDGPYDLVVLRSVLGQVGVHERPERQRTALRRLLAAVRPGGELWILENARASPLHVAARRRFGAGRHGWRYLRSSELLTLLAPCGEVRAACLGLTAAFGRTEPQRSALAAVDRVLERLAPPAWRYVLAVVATRGEDPVEEEPR